MKPSKLLVHFKRRHLFWFTHEDASSSSLSLLRFLLFVLFVELMASIAIISGAESLESSDSDVWCELSTTFPSESNLSLSGASSPSSSSVLPSCLLSVWKLAFPLESESLSESLAQTSWPNANASGGDKAEWANRRWIVLQFRIYSLFCRPFSTYCTTNCGNKGLTRSHMSCCERKVFVCKMTMMLAIIIIIVLRHVAS